MQSIIFPDDCKKFIFEQEQIKDLTIDYDSIEYVECQFTLNVNGVKIIQNLNCGISTSKGGYLLIKDDLNKLIKFLKVELWDCCYKCQWEQQTKQDQLIIEITHQEYLSQITIRLYNLEDFKLLVQQLKSLCLITSPLLQDEYKLISKIGSGSQAQIDLYAPLSNPKKKYAVKTYLIKGKSKQNQNEIFNEIQFLRELSYCKNIISIEQVFKVEAEKLIEIHVVMNFAKYGSLTQLIQREAILEEDKLRLIMEQLLLATDLMHKNGIIHRDLKPDNILILKQKKLEICLADLGMACRVNDTKLLMIKCGTPSYVDPDVLKRRQFSTSSDIFSLGSLFYNLVTRKILYPGSKPMEILQNNQYQNPIPIVEKNCQHISPHCRDLLKSMLDIHQESRPSAEQCLKHKWFKKDFYSLKNLLEVNRQAAIYNSGKIIDCSNIAQPQLSFVFGPNYFQNLNSQFMSLMSKQGFTPKNIRSSSQQTGKLCYNQILSENRLRVETAKANSLTDNVDDFSTFLNLKQQAPQAKKKSAFFKVKIQNQNQQQLELLDENQEDEIQLSDRNKEKLDHTISQQSFEDLKMSEELDSLTEIESKVIQRVNIDDIQSKQESLCYKNLRKFKNYQK